MSKKKLPGGVELTQKIKYLRKNNYLEFVKTYQQILLKKKEERMKHMPKMYKEV